MTTKPPSLSPEMLVPRLGDSLVQKGHIREEDLQKALTYQQKQVAQGKSCLFGQALVELKLLKQSVLDQVVTEQIIQLRMHYRRSTEAWSNVSSSAQRNCRARWSECLNSAR